MSKPLDILGAPASNAGDSFHEAWALRHALRLLDQGTELTHVTVEGVRDAPETDNTANWDGVDCALYYDDPQLPEKSRFELVQLKYSVASPNSSWTISRFCTSKKKTGNNSVARRLTDAFMGASKNKNFDTIRKSITVKLVSNQPISKALQQQIDKAARGEKTGTSYGKLKTATGLSDRNLKLFCERLRLVGRELARADLKTENTLAVAELIRAPVKDMADNLGMKIRERMGPEGARSGDVIVDYTDTSSIRAMFEKIRTFDALIVAVGGDSVFKLYNELSKEDYEHGFTRKFMAQVNLVKIGTKYANDKGSFTLSSGYLSHYPNAYSAATGPFNAVVDSFVLGTAPLLPRDLRLNVVSPAPVVETERVGLGLVSAAQTAKGYVDSAIGMETGKVFRVWGGLENQPQPLPI